VTLSEEVPPGEPAFFVEAMRGDGNVIYRSRNLKGAALPKRSLGFSNADIRDNGVRLGTFTRDGITVGVAADLDPIESLADDLVTAFICALPFVLALVVFGGRWIAHKALEPIRLITQSAEQVTAQHLDRRVPVPDSNDPIQRLAIVLNGTLERLETSFHQAMRFSADASHELKTPLTVLRTSIEALLRSDSLPEADQRNVAGLLEQTKRISSITEGLLLLARADAGKLVIERRSADLREIVIACCDDARIIAESTGVRIQVDLPDRAEVCGDKTRLMQIVSNLLDNAVKFNHPKGEVRVTLLQKENFWSLTISNTGPGIAPEHQLQVFERFFRSEHFADVSGYGLGLSLARELTRAHGGDLSLTQSDTRWTELQVRLPVAPIAAAQEASLSAV
jgi:signal transduction histidine kinase